METCCIFDGQWRSRLHYQPHQAKFCFSGRVDGHQIAAVAGVESLVRASFERHLPAWQAFNKNVGTSGTVGIWHETYAASPGSYENIYLNMPPFGLGKIGTVQPAAGGRQSAASRLSAHLRGENKEAASPRKPDSFELEVGRFF